jgi:hypothetical protein
MPAKDVEKRRATSIAWAKAHAEELKKRHHDYHKAHAEEINARCRLYNKEHREENKKRRELNAEHIKMRNKIYRETHKEEIKRKGILYFEKNREKIKVRKRLYDKEHPTRSRGPEYIIKRRNTLRKSKQIERDMLGKSYIIKRINQTTKLSRDTIKQHPEFIENWKQQIKIKRLLNSKRNENITTS